MALLRSKYFWCVVVIGIALSIGKSLDWPIISFIRASKCESSYSFINPDVVCGRPDTIRKTGYMQTQLIIQRYVNERKADGSIVDASVYFRDLVHGPTFGVNELAEFAPASLLKLPLAIVYLNSAESQPESLNVTLQYVGTTTLPEQQFKPRVSAEKDRSYMVKELLEMMIRYSDNASYQTLDAFLSESEHRSNLRLNVFQEIGLINPDNRIEETITVRGYASLFRILYNVSYLNVEYSELLLTWLAGSEYAAGVRAGLPPEIPFAGKFGERIILGTNEKQLHECGIVYYPGNPYLICVMTKGNTWDELNETIREISRIVYDEVNSRRI